MRYRRLDQGDYAFGHGGADYLVDIPECVGQSVLTRLLLMEGEWFLDTSEGTPYSSSVLGKGTGSLYDMAIQQRMLETAGVTGLASYSSRLDTVSRRLSVSALVDTRFGATRVEVTL